MVDGSCLGSQIRVETATSTLAPFRAKAETQCSPIAKPLRYAAGTFEITPRGMERRLHLWQLREPSKLFDEKDRNWRSVSHAIIRADPETRHNSLDLDRGKTFSIVGVETKESETLIEALRG
jgi:alpha-ketoglutarate-dependent taurine dioxygenase